MCVCVCVCVCERARARARACVRPCVRVCARCVEECIHTTVHSGFLKYLLGPNEFLLCATMPDMIILFLIDKAPVPVLSTSSKHSTA